MLETKFTEFLKLYDQLSCNIYRDVKHTEGFCIFFNLNFYPNCNICTGFKPSCMPKVCDNLEKITDIYVKLELEGKVIH